MMQVSPTEISVLVASAVFGCLATAVAFNAITGKPAATIALNWRKHVWSIIFAMPILLLFRAPLPDALVFIIVVAWLIFVPTLASKYVFGAHDRPWSFLLMLHSAFAFTTVSAVFLLYELLGISL